MEQFTTDELIGEVAKRMGIVDTDIDDEYKRKIFADLKNTDGLVRFLYEVAAGDKDRYFGAQADADRQVIRGAFSRVMWLRTLIMNSGKEKLDSSIAKL